MQIPIWRLPPDLEVGMPVAMLESAVNVWHLPKNPWEQIWSKFTGKGERIAILDTGYSEHDLLPKPIASRSFISGQSIKDGNAHGTHCAGTALGREGIGVAPGADLIVGKCLSDAGAGGSDGITAAINWAIDEGATIISLSLGGGDPYEPTRKALQRAAEKFILVCASAGNSGQQSGRNTIGYPGRFMETYCSGSMDRNGRISSFSSAGREMDGVTPGSEIVSTSNTDRRGFKQMSGTSMSCPFSAGFFAVVREGMARAGMARLGGIEEWRPWLAQFFDDKGAPGKDDVWGVGTPNYNKILDYLLQLSLRFI